MEVDKDSLTLLHEIVMRETSLIKQIDLFLLKSNDNGIVNILILNNTKQTEYLP